MPGNLGGGVVPDFTMINFTGTTVDANFGTIKGSLAAKPRKWTSEVLEGNKPIRSQTVCTTRSAGVQHHLGKLRHAHDLSDIHLAELDPGSDRARRETWPVGRVLCLGVAHLGRYGSCVV